MDVLKHKFIRRVAMPILACAFCVAPPHGYCQWVEPSTGIVAEPTATATQFIRYGNTPVSLYTGSVSPSIPLYTYEDYEFSVPIALNYSFTGQKPNEHAGSFGLGWVLSGGGYITRQINHYPDETLGGGYSDYAEGFYWLHTSRYTIPMLNTEGVFPPKPIQTTTIPSYFYTLNGRRFEAEPDVFSFNFMGHSGKFMFWEKGEIVVFENNQPQGIYKITPTIKANQFAGFQIVTKDGYTYIFGGKEELYIHQDVMVSQPSKNNGMGNANQPPTMWTLASVKAPSGRELLIEYSRGNEPIETAQPMSFMVQADTYQSSSGLAERCVDWWHISYMSVRKQHNLYLKKISLANTFSIDFAYSGERHVEKGYNTIGGPNMIITEGLLESVVVKDLSNGSTVRSISCGYSEGQPNKVPFLSYVRFSDIGRYDLSYCKMNGSCFTPYKGTCNIDHWGYSNGRANDSSSKFLPASSIDSDTGEETINGTERDPDFDYAVSGAIEEIVYPTGGKTRFQYERNDYSSGIVKSSANHGIPGTKSYPSIQIAGGIRIKQIDDCDYQSETGQWVVKNSRTYTYKAEGKSSGNLLHTPRYRGPYIRTGGPNAYNNMYMAASDLLDCTDAGHHIEYSLVTETNSDGSYCEYQYSTYCLGNTTFQQDFIPLKHLLSGVNLNPGYENFYKRPGYQSQQGNISSKTTYHAKKNPSDAGVPSYAEQYSYAGLNRTMWSIHMTLYFWYQRYIQTGSSYLTGVKKTHYYDGHAIWTSWSTVHDLTTGYLTNVYARNSDGKVIQQDVSYAPKDYLGEDYGPYPIKTQLSVQAPGETTYKTTEINKYEYVFSTAGPRLYKHWKTHLSAPKTDTSDAGAEPDLMLEGEFCSDKNRYVELIDRAGHVTTYLYGNDGCHLLAVVKNASYAEVTAVTGVTFNRYSLSSSQETQLRSIQKALVTTYSYTPLTGLATSIDPSGNKQEYRYDDMRRLSQVFNGGNLEQEFKYQISTLQK